MLTGPIGIDADNFMDVLDNGVMVCKLAALMELRANNVCVQTSLQVAYITSRL